MSKLEAAFLVDEAARLRLERSLFHQRWEKIRYFIFPDSLSFFSIDTPGIGKRLQILDNTAEDAAEMAAAGLHGLLTNSASQWMRYGLLDDDLAERDGPARYLDAVTRRTMALYRYAPSKFNVASYQCYREAIAYANWCMFVEDRLPSTANPGGLPLFRSISMPTVVWDEDDEGNIAKVYREFSRPLWAAYLKWGTALTPRMLDLYKDRRNWHTQHTFMHAVVPRENADTRILNARNKPFASYWLAKDEKEIIVEGGYDEMPYICGRWNLLPGELYARGPGDKALPDSALLQRTTGAFLDAAEVIGEPPFVAPDKGLVKKLNLKRRAINYVRADYLMQNAGPRPLLTGGDTRVTEELLQAIRARIQRAFLRDLLQLIRDPEATATQVLELKEEQMRGMSPILAHITQDWLGPLAVRTFAVLQRAGAFHDLEVPREIVGMSPKPVFISPAARAQQLAEARGIAQGYEAAKEIIALDQGVLDNVDMDKQFRTIITAVGTPLSELRSPAEVAQRKAARVKAQQQQAQEESAKNISTVAKNAAPLVKATTDAQAQQPQNRMAA